MYLLFTPEGRAQLKRGRLLELEQHHYALTLRLGDMDLVGVPASTPERQALMRDLSVTERCMQRYRELLADDFPSVDTETPDQVTENADETEKKGELR